MYLLDAISFILLFALISLLFCVPLVGIGVDDGIAEVEKVGRRESALYVTFQMIFLERGFDPTISVGFG